jgi:hypothetical protein
MLKVIVMLSIVLTLSSCATNPYVKEYQRLDNMYKSGQITPNEYNISRFNLMQQETAWRQQQAQAWNQWGQQMQQQSIERQRSAAATAAAFVQAGRPNTMRLQTTCHTDKFGNTNCY